MSSPCRTCVYASPHSDLIDRLECHRFPPIAGYNGWPHVGVDQTCGEHVPLAEQIRVNNAPAPVKSVEQTGRVEPVKRTEPVQRNVTTPKRSIKSAK